MGQVIKSITVLGLAAGSLMCQAGHADDADVFNIHAGASYIFDDNLFRLDDIPLPSGLKGRSDRILGMNAGVELDVPFRQQRFTLDAMATRNLYAENDFLDHTAYRIRGGWNWHFTPRVSGLLSVDRDEALTSFEDYRAYTGKNMRTNSATRFEADVWLASNWHALVGLARESRENSQTFREEDNFEQMGWHLGARYDRGNGRSLTVRYLNRDGEYVDRVVDPVRLLDDAYAQGDLELNLAYPINDKTRVDGTLAYLDRGYDHFEARDYAGWRGRVGLTWNPTGKLGIKGEYARDISDWQDDESSYRVTNGFSIGAIWAKTAKQDFSASLEYKRRDYEGRAFTSVLPAREEDTAVLSVGWTWSPTRASKVNLQLRHELRDTNRVDYDYDATSLSASARFLF